jgi:hypothetical protein
VTAVSIAALAATWEVNLAAAGVGGVIGGLGNLLNAAATPNANGWTYAAAFGAGFVGGAAAGLAITGQPWLSAVVAGTLGGAATSALNHMGDNRRA